jgi:crossover junction endodeoxyribonuclease RusA
LDGRAERTLTLAITDNPKHSIKITVPLIPPSVNHYCKHTRNGRHYVTKEAKAFKEAVYFFSRGLSVSAKRFEVTLRFFVGRNQRLDIDNAAKVPLDSLVASRIIHSDAAVDKLTIEKGRDERDPRTEITVTEL